MHAHALVAAAGLLAASGVLAQEIDLPAPRLGIEERERAGPLAEAFKRSSPLYGGDQAANPNDRQFPGFRTDPRLVLGYAVNRHFAIEAGYSHLLDEGFHRIDPFLNRGIESAVAAGALGEKSHTTYVAAKVSLPLSERLSAYGKFGIAHSQLRSDNPLADPTLAPTVRNEALGTSGRGAYGALGVQYQAGKRVTVKGEQVVNGSASKFGATSNASGVKGSVGIGF